MNKAKLNIRYAMTKHGISYATLAERTGIDKGNISKLFTGNPTISKIEAVADAIGIDIRDLFFPTDENGNVVETTIEEPKTEPSATEAAKVGMIMCPHCHCGFEITGVVTPPNS